MEVSADALIPCANQLFCQEQWQGPELLHLRLHVRLYRLQNLELLYLQESPLQSQCRQLCFQMRKPSAQLGNKPLLTISQQKLPTM